MTAKEKYLKPHRIFGGKTFSAYCTHIPKFYFKKEVPEDVVKNFQIVEQLLAHSYYEYRFIDEAYAKALSTFEMAMKLRLKDFMPQSKKHTFYPLIHTLTKLNLFDSPLGYLKHLDLIRNHYAHPERHSYGGMFMWNRIEVITRLINEMYEDVTLRKERQTMGKEFIEQLREYKLDLGLVMEIKGLPTILHSMRLLFINNKREPPTYLFVCIPLFDLKIDNGSTKVPFAFKAKLVNPSFGDGTLRGKSFSAKQKVTFSPIAQYKELLPTYESWNSEYKSIHPVYFEPSLDHYIPDILIPEIEEFQRI